MNQDDLEQWTLAHQLKEDDLLAIEKYQKKDDSVVKQQQLQREKLLKQLDDKKRDLEQEKTETAAVQIELEKTAEDFVHETGDRNSLIERWEASITGLNQRDEMIKAAGEAFADNKTIINAKNEERFQESQILAQHQQNSKEIQLQTENMQRLVEKKREEYGVIRQNLTQLEDELEVMKNTLGKASSDHAQKKITVTKYNEMVENKKAKLENMKKQVDKIENNVNVGYKELSNLKSKNESADTLLETTKQRLKDMDNSLREKKEKLYKESERLYKKQQEEKDVISEISGTNAQNKNLGSKILQMDTQGLLFFSFFSVFFSKN